MKKMSPLKAQSAEALKKAREHLVYSFRKVQKISLSRELTEEELETFESFSSRFARFSDMIISKHLRRMALEKDPAFRGSVIDLLNQAEKFGWIESAETWKRIRQLRNVAAHEYEAEDYKKLYQELVTLTPSLLDVSFDG